MVYFLRNRITIPTDYVLLKPHVWRMTKENHYLLFYGDIQCSLCGQPIANVGSIHCNDCFHSIAHFKNTKTVRDKRYSPYLENYVKTLDAKKLIKLWGND